MRVLLVSSAYFPNVLGGAEVSSKLLAEALHKKVEVKVLTLGLSNSVEVINGVLVRRIYLPHISEARLLSIQNSLLGRGKLLLSLVSKDLSRNILDILDFELRHFQPDVVHCVNNLFPLPVRLLYKYFHDREIPIIQTMRDLYLLGRSTITTKKRFHRIYFKKSLKYVDIFHFTTTTMLSRYSKDLPAKSRKVVIPNAVNHTFDENVWKNTLEKKPDFGPLNILYVGVLEKKKGIHLLEAVIKKLLKSQKNTYRFWIVGSGTYENRLRNSLKELIADHRVRILGWIPERNVWKIAKICHVVVLPSQWEEMFGRVLIEGYYSGCLPVGSSRGAIPEVIHDKELVFDSEDELISLLEKSTDRVWRNTKLESLIPHMRQFSIDHHVSMFIDLYKKALKKHS